MRDRLLGTIVAASLALVQTGCSSLGTWAEPDPAAAMRQTLEKAERSRLRAARAPNEATAKDAAMLLREGDGLRAAGSHGDAMWRYLQAHELDSTAPEPLLRIGGLHLSREPERSESIFLELIKAHPESPGALTGLGLAHLARQDWGEARIALERALTHDPKFPAGNAALGVVLDRLGETTLARMHYERAIAQQGSVYHSLNNLGVSYLTTTEFEAAVAVLERAAALEPRDRAVQNNLGLALGRLGRYDDALEAFRAAGGEQTALNNLGYAQFLNGDPEAALESYERALLTSGDARLDVLRNLRIARDHLESGDPAPNPAATKPAPVAVQTPPAPPEQQGTIEGTESAGSTENAATAGEAVPTDACDPASPEAAECATDQDAASVDEPASDEPA